MSTGDWIQIAIFSATVIGMIVIPLFSCGFALWRGVSQAISSLSEIISELKVEVSNLRSRLEDINNGNSPAVVSHGQQLAVHEKRLDGLDDVVAEHSHRITTLEAMSGSGIHRRGKAIDQ